ncbi:hypothetical protein U2444_14725, partial [Listeria monocytogenes]|uniref:hypothetical protein n=1 Tax=Listeria monocytogenes TaxID=1639 RepID=UPI002FDBEB4B
GKNSIFVVQMFGTPSVQKVTLAEEPTKVEVNNVPAYKSQDENSSAQKVAGINMQAEEKKELAIINSRTMAEGSNLAIEANIEGYPVKVF